MSVKPPDGDDGSRVLSSASLSDYIDEDATLLGRVDFLGLIADLFKGALFAAVSIFAGLVVASREAISDIYYAGYDGIWEIVDSVGGGFTDAQQMAVESAGEQIDVLGLIALPTSIVVTLLSVSVFAFIAYLFVARWLLD